MSNPSANVKKLRLGVLGLGEGRSIISAALASEWWDLAMLCDVNEPLGRDRCAEFRFDRFTTRFDDLLADPTIDAIGIYTPDPLHAEHVRRTLEAGKHAICTKPLLDSLDDAPALMQAAEQSKRHVFVGQSSRFFEPMIRQRRDHDAGRHGEVFSVESHYHADHRWFLSRDWARNGGLKWLYGGLSHPVDLVRWYLPDIREVMGYGLLTETGRSYGLRDPDAMHFVFSTASGKIGRVSGCYSSPPGNAQRDSGMTCIVRGLAGTSHADYSELRYSTHFSGEGAVQYDLGHRAGHYFRFGGKSHHAGEYQNYIDYFARCVHEGTTPNPDLREGIVTVAVMRAMEQSLQTRQPVTVASVLARHGLESLIGH
jgi:predicted dehydrogenase